MPPAASNSRWCAITRQGKTPQVFYARRSLCLACHQNAAPIFARPLWDETPANPAIAARLKADAARFLRRQTERHRHRLFHRHGDRPRQSVLGLADAVAAGLRRRRGRRPLPHGGVRCRPGLRAPRHAARAEHPAHAGSQLENPLAARPCHPQSRPAQPRSARRAARSGATTPCCCARRSKPGRRRTRPPSLSGWPACSTSTLRSS